MDACCGRFIDLGMLPDTPEELMRSRYTANVLGNEAYLRQTWSINTCPAGPLIESPFPQWLGLQVRSASVQGNEGTVEFVARYKINGRAHRLHEISRFLREPDDMGRLAWRYVDGQFR